MEETELYKQRLQAIAEKRRIQEEQERTRREMEEERLRLQQMKRKSLRDQWLMEGSAAPLDSSVPRSPLWGSQAQQLEERINKLQTEQSRLAEEESHIGKQEGAETLNHAGKDAEKIQVVLLDANEEAQKHSNEKKENGAKTGHSTTAKFTASQITAPVLAAPPKPAVRLRRAPPTDEAAMAIGEGDRTAVFAMQISVEKNLKTGDATVLSTVPLDAHEFEAKGHKVFDDGTKSIFAVGAGAEKELGPEEVDRLLNQTAWKKSEHEAEPPHNDTKDLNMASHNGGKEITMNHNLEENSELASEKGVNEEGKVDLEAGAEDAHAVILNHNPPESLQEDQPKTNGLVNGFEKLGDEIVRHEEKEEEPVIWENGQTQKSGGDIEETEASKPEDLDSLMENPVSLTFLGFSDAKSEEESKEVIGEVMRAEHVIITEEGEEIPIEPKEELTEPPEPSGADLDVEKTTETIPNLCLQEQAIEAEVALNTVNLIGVLDEPAAEDSKEVYKEVDLADITFEPATDLLTPETESSLIPTAQEQAAETPEKPEIQPLLKEAAAAGSKTPPKPSEQEPLLAPTVQPPPVAAARREPPSSAIKGAESAPTPSRDMESRAEALEPSRPKQKACQCCSLM
ncbi:palmdelphin-like isoform X1 [Acipenser ruthenus]|uniref:palmdelphin-like isoform X1 n=1 Tax=Acipenser ruthenus TaxID=7906 RepID=UPI0027422B4D|nr:palmdelphin-like isoform X1 [Acipenser ruthenus]XP_058863982.1 palmdelphin-like isoform X1 [Acipenser ruthenus]